MKLRSILLVLIPVAIFSSCTVLSFYPLYTENELIKDDRILGEWQTTSENMNTEDTIRWSISFIQNQDNTNKYTYTLNLYHQKEETDSAKFLLHIVELDGNTYLDFFPEEGKVNNDFFTIHLIPVHTFAKLEIGDELKISWFDSDWLEKLFENNKIRMKHEKTKDVTLLTAKPQELQKFIIKYANDEKAYSEYMNYTLSKL
ncbi:hypothetical protein [Chondrinema litorale]|uniref:hypothetical protein n=1 Tax=Chondrinema litorale TaxID=2994555 RepID=UPI002543E69A|nr:hypothetical protein [Chondrinema litorale]UZR97527.1 hypothetical protein OQ292_26235 [Chondrinema litorale]